MFDQPHSAVRFSPFGTESIVHNTSVAFSRVHSGASVPSARSSGYPGFADLYLNTPADYGEETEPNIFHFPDGNASVARLLVRNMIPAVAPDNTMEDIVTARFDYGKLDDP